jgi:hypothetical protein
VLLLADIGAFFVEFSRFEVESVATALRALSKDSAFVDESERLLNLDARLKLLERLALARAVPAAPLRELKDVTARARRLREQRDAVAANLAAATALKPAAGRASEYAGEAIALQEKLEALTRRLDGGQPRDARCQQPD